MIIVVESTRLAIIIEFPVATPKKHYRSKFKADVALKVLAHPLEIDLIAKHHGITIEEASRWRDELQEGAVKLFKDDRTKKSSRAYRDQRQKIIRRAIMAGVTVTLVTMIVKFAVNMAMSGGG